MASQFDPAALPSGCRVLVLDFNESPRNATVHGQRGSQLVNVHYDGNKHSTINQVPAGRIVGLVPKEGLKESCMLSGDMECREQDGGRFQSIRGVWSFVGEKSSKKSPFHLTRALSPGEHGNELLQGEFEFDGWFDDEEQTVEERGVSLTFNRVGSQGRFSVSGQGCNEFGVFKISGNATPSSMGCSVYCIQLHKYYPMAPQVGSKVVRYLPQNKQYSGEIFGFEQGLYLAFFYKDGKIEKLNESEATKICASSRTGRPTKANGRNGQVKKGTHVIKYFLDTEGETRPYKGKVMSYDPKKNLYKILYEDNEQEEVDEEVLIQIEVAEATKDKALGHNLFAKSSPSLRTDVLQVSESSLCAVSALQDEIKASNDLHHKHGEEIEKNKKMIVNTCELATHNFDMIGKCGARLKTVESEYKTAAEKAEEFDRARAEYADRVLSLGNFIDEMKGDIQAIRADLDGHKQSTERSLSRQEANTNANTSRLNEMGIDMEKLKKEGCERDEKVEAMAHFNQHVAIGLYGQGIVINQLQNQVATVLASSVTPAAAIGVAPSVTPAAAIGVAPSVTPAAAIGVAPSVTPAAAIGVAPSVTPAAAIGVAPSVTPAPTDGEIADFVAPPRKRSPSILYPLVQKRPNKNG